MRLFFLLLLAPCIALANGNDRNSHDHDAASSSDATAAAHAVVGDISVTFQPDTGAAATTFAEGSIRGGDTSTEVNVVTENPDDIRIRNVPSLRAPYMNATAPCRIALSAGVTLVGGGVSGGASVEDKECTRRQSAQTWASMGVPAMGLYLMCRSMDMQRAGVESEQCDAMIAQMQIEAELSEESPGPKLLAQVDDAELARLQARVGALEGELSATRAELRETEKTAQEAPEAAQRVVDEHDADIEMIQERVRSVKSSESFKRLYDG